MRTKATTNYEKVFFKLMNNTEFGNIMENIRSRVNIEVGTDENIKKFAPVIIQRIIG